MNSTRENMAIEGLIRPNAGRLAAAAVRILTRIRIGRRESDAQPAARLRLLTLFPLLLSAAAGADANWQKLSDITGAAERYLEDRIGSRDERMSARAGQLDARLKLARCDRPLEPFLRRGTKVGNRTVVGVRCTGSSPWKVYVPVDVIVTENVLIARRSLQRDHPLSADDVTIEQRDVSRLASGYLSDPLQLKGKRLKHQVMSGHVITPRMLQAELAVRRGQTVTLVVRNSTMAISMSGKALMDGAVDQRIRVENLTSGRIVEGIVRSPEHVEVLVY